MRKSYLLSFIALALGLPADETRSAAAAGKTQAEAVPALTPARSQGDRRQVQPLSASMAAEGAR